MHALSEASERFDYLEDATPIPRLLSSALGAPLTVLDLSIYSDSAWVRIQSRADARHIDGYLLRGGTLDGPKPEHLDPNQRAVLHKLLFDLNAVDFRVVARVVSETVRRLGDECGAVDFVHLKKHPGFFFGTLFGAKLRWQAFVNTGRRQGLVRYAVDGKFIELIET